MEDKSVVAQQFPYTVKLEAGKEYYWCACGRSKKQPFCDGSHHGTTITPKAFKVEKTGEFHLCGCKLTKNPPFCDGSHNDL